jgi:hypothetical protein
MSNRVLRIDFLADASGEVATLSATTASGAPIQLQLDYKLLRGLHESLPVLLQAMERQQAGGPTH